MKKINVTVGISAFNEEANIGSVLKSILAQKETNFRLKQIIVVSDKSTDNTDKIILSLTSPKIKLIRNKVQKGKAGNLATIFSKAVGDVIIIFDADIAIENNALSHLSTPFIDSQNVAMVGSNATPKTPVTFIEKSVYASFVSYDWLKKRINDGHNVYNVKGCGIALSTKFIKTVHIPKTVFAEDIFLYFKAKSQGWQFRFAPKAIVWYRMPQTLADHIKQNRRWSASPGHIQKLFGKIVDQEYEVPIKLKIQSLMYGIIKDPIHSIAIFAINAYCRQTLKSSPHVKSTWSSVGSTKV